MSINCTLYINHKESFQTYTSNHPLLHHKSFTQFFMTKFYQVLHKFVAKQQQSINDKRLLLGRAAICNLTAKPNFMVHKCQKCGHQTHLVTARTLQRRFPQSSEDNGQLQEMQLECTLDFQQCTHGAPSPNTIIHKVTVT